MFSSLTWQDVKNQVILTNMWLNLVSISLHVSLYFVSICTVLYKVWNMSTFVESLVGEKEIKTTEIVSGGRNPSLLD